MFFHTKQLQYHAKPDRPDAIYAKKLQEVLGGMKRPVQVTPPGVGGSGGQQRAAAD